MDFVRFIFVLGSLYFAVAIIQAIFNYAVLLPIHKLFRLRSFGTTAIILLAGTTLATIYLLAALLTFTILSRYDRTGSGIQLAINIAISSVFILGVTANNISTRLRNGLYADEKIMGEAGQSALLYVDIALLICSIPILLLMLVYSPIAINPATYGILRATRYVVTLPWVGWIVGGFGLIAAVGTMKDGLLTVLTAPFVLLSGRGKKSAAGYSASQYAESALIAWERGERSEALRFYDQALDLEPNNAVALLNRGNLQIELGHFDEAISDLDRAKALDPTLPTFNADLFRGMDSEMRETVRQRLLQRTA